MGASRGRNLELGEVVVPPLLPSQLIGGYLRFCCWWINNRINPINCSCHWWINGLCWYLN